MDRARFDSRHRRIGWLIIKWAEAVITGRDQSLRAGIRQLIACQLFEDKAIKGLVFVKGLDDIIAIPPDIGFEGIAFVAVGLGITDKIEPMPAPAFAVLRASQEIGD